jgi:hypothetical protein
MSDIQQYMVLSLIPLDHGLELAPEWKVVVTYADHVEALRQAKEVWRTEWDTNSRSWYEQGQRDALAGAAQRVEALPWSEHIRPDLTSYVWVDRSEAIAAIKGESDAVS